MLAVQNQEVVREFIDSDIYACQSLLVEELLKNEVFSYDEIENLYVPFHGKHAGIMSCSSCKVEFDELDLETEQCRECFENEQEAQEIYEWWLVSDWLAEKLREKKEPILENNFGTWWGRCTTGQAIYMDYVIQRIHDETMY